MTPCRRHTFFKAGCMSFLSRALRTNVLLNDIFRLVYLVLGGFQWFGFYVHDLIMKIHSSRYVQLTFNIASQILCPSVKYQQKRWARTQRSVDDRPKLKRDK